MRDLFEANLDRPTRDTPLADRMRPASLEEVVGQEQLLAPGRLLRRLIDADRVPSLILWGPPGSGKTTLARLIAEKSRARFATLSAVLSGVAELKAELVAARRAKGERGERTLLFVDEIHRWSKSQQDALLQAVEKGVVTLIGATTENPSFELNAALLSRAKVFVLEKLGDASLVSVLARALADPARGLGAQRLAAGEGALEVIAAGSFGDARRALSTLEIAAENALLLRELSEDGAVRISREVAEEALQHRTLLYDKAGDAHYGVVSAFIKSMRGSDPDAAVYYMARMLESGEDPRFILRRMVIFASEDVGNADPTALAVAIDALHAFELVGLPEGVLPLSQAVLYLASAPKSNTALVAYGAAKKDVDQLGPLPIPKKLLNAPTGLSRAMGHGQGYRYPHDLGGLAAGETYLPDRLVGRRYYRPTANGLEKEIGERIERWRNSGAHAEGGDGEGEDSK
jgi:putative ATPase